MPIPRRTVNQILQYRDLVRSVNAPTVILCGNQEATVWPIKMVNERAYGNSVFWVPYPGLRLGVPLTFSHVIVDPSFDKNIQSNVDWFEREVLFHVDPVGCKVVHIDA